MANASITVVVNGNVAVMQDALKRILASFTADHYGQTDGVLSTKEIFDLIKSALAAPVRNCDRFDDPDKALIAYADSVCRELGEKQFAVDGEKFFKVDRAPFVWLFAPADEKEAAE